MQNAHTYDRATEANEIKRQSESLLSNAAKAFLALVCLCVIGNFLFFSVVKEPSSWDLGILIGFQVFLWIAAILGTALVYIEKRYESRKK